MTDRFSIMKTIVAVTVAFGMSAALNRSHAAEGAVDSWIVASQQQLAAKAEAKASVVLQAIGSRMIPVFVEALPRFKTVANALTPSTLQ